MGTFKDVAKGVVIGLIVNGIILGFPYVANYFGLDYPWQLLLMERPLWMMFLTISILIPTVVAVMRGRHRVGAGFFAVPRRPESDVVKFKCKHFGVIWRVLYGRASPFRDEEPYAFCESYPYCPECDYQMEAEQRGLLKRYYWICHSCGKLYKCPVNPYDADRIIEKKAEADIRTGRLKIP